MTVPTSSLDAGSCPTTTSHLLGDQGGVVPAADVGGVPHKRADLVKRDALLSQLAPERVPEVEGIPGEPRLLLDLLVLPIEVVRVPAQAHR